jgi:hypothetical protein
MKRCGRAATHNDGQPFDRRYYLILALSALLT